MDPQNWLERVERKLRRSGLPLAYVKRTRDELLDHVEECEEAGRASEILTHCPDGLATTLVLTYRHGSWVRRVPPALLLCLPIVMSVFIPLAYYVLAGMALDMLLPSPFERATPLLPNQLRVVQWFYYLGKIIAPLVAALLLRSVAIRMARPWGWGAALFSTLCVVTFFTQTKLTLTANSPEISLALDLAIAKEGLVVLGQVLQCLLIVAVGAWLIRQQRNEQRQPLV